MFDWEETRTTTAAPEDLWAVYTDVARWPEWNGTIDAATLHGPFESGVTGHVTVSFGPSQNVSFQLENVEPITSFDVVWNVGPLVKTRMSHRIERVEDGSRFTHAYHTGGVMAPFAFLQAAAAHSRARAAMSRIAQLAEARARR